MAIDADELASRELLRDATHGSAADDHVSDVRSLLPYVIELEQPGVPLAAIRAALLAAIGDESPRLRAPTSDPDIDLLQVHGSSRLEVGAKAALAPPLTPFRVAAKHRDRERAAAPSAAPQTIWCGNG
jgi:hypothetical protein